MQLEYFDDLQSPARPVLLTYGDDPREAALLQDAIQRLVTGNVNQQIRIHELPGFRSVNGCSLVAHVASSNLGVLPVEGADLAFHCALDPTTWSQVSGLLEPFADSARPSSTSIHQYLTSDGPADWIIATSRHW
jgi:hypothetical protein